MISEYNDDKNDHNNISNDSTDTCVQSALQAIVTHYNQQIHEVSKEISPHFYPILGYPPQIPCVVQFWIDRLLEEYRLEQYEEERQYEAIMEWIYGYVTDVRPILLNSTIRGVPVLQHYELLLSQWLKHVTSMTSNGTTSLQHIERMYTTIKILASDITLLSKSSKDSLCKCSPYIRSNLVLAILLRLITHSFSVLTKLVSGPGHIVSIPEKRAILVRCTVSLLAFHPDRIDPAIFSRPLIIDNNKNNDNKDNETIIGKLCLCPTPEGIIDEDVDVEIQFRKSLTLESIDWSHQSLDSSDWIDPVVGVASRACEVAWGKLSTLQSLITDDKTSSINEVGTTGDIATCLIDDLNDETNAIETDFDKGKRTRRDVCTSWGLVEMAEAVRAHFFGRDMILFEKPEQIVSTKIILGRNVTKTEPRKNDMKPFKEIPSRIHVAIHFVSVLNSEAFISTKTTTTTAMIRGIVLHILPICFELIDDSSTVHMSIGISALLHLLDVTASSIDAELVSEIWNEFAEATLSVLNRSFTSCREGNTLALIGRVQCSLFNVLRGKRKERRQVTRNWFSLIHQLSHRSATTAIIWESLVGGIIPLLKQHSELPNADAMEMGRLGLSILLPLAVGDFVDVKTQIAALAALINLMLGAYPILPHHGGKIMTSLLAAGATIDVTNDREREESAALLILVKHTAAVALCLCKSNDRALSVLQSILDGPEIYRDDLLNIALDIQEQSRQLEAHMRISESFRE